MTRSILQNLVNELASMIGGIIVIVTEMSFNKESIDLGGIEFTSDGVIVMKHGIEEAMLVRIMEFRKLRRALITVAEVSFTIREGIGIQVFIPPYLEEVKPPRLDVHSVSYTHLTLPTN